jgi:hypothetical protein
VPSDGGLALVAGQRRHADAAVVAIPRKRGDVRLTDLGLAPVLRALVSMAFGAAARSWGQGWPETTRRAWP